MSQNENKKVVLRFHVNGELNQWIAPFSMVKGLMNLLAGSRRITIEVKSGGISEKVHTILFVRANQLLAVVDDKGLREYTIYQPATPISDTLGSMLLDKLRKNKKWHSVHRVNPQQEIASYRL